MAFYKHDKINTVADDPVLGPEWHPTKNPDLDPPTLTTGSGKRAIWLCAQGHEWEARINRRGCCPVCDGRIVTSENCLAATNPDLALEWDYESNGDLTPKDVTEKSITKMGWVCTKDPRHRYMTKVFLRTAGQGCSYCAGKLVAEWDSLAAKYPHVAEEWHPTKNGKLTPRDVLPKSSRMAWWKCKNGHVYKAKISNRTSIRTPGKYVYHGSGCPTCAHAK